MSIYFLIEENVYEGSLKVSQVLFTPRSNSFSKIFFLRFEIKRLKLRFNEFELLNKLLGSFVVVCSCIIGATFVFFLLLLISNLILS
mgnify:CR=1 FL=1